MEGPTARFPSTTNETTAGIARRFRRRAVTLVELLVTLAILALLLALLLPSLRSARDQVRTLGCASNLRSVSLEFQLFADDRSTQGRGGSETLGRNRFRINDFQEHLYRIDEFWDHGGQTSAPLQGPDELMLCPANAGRLTKQKGFPCGNEAVFPVENVAFALNMRLYRAIIEVGTTKFLAPVHLTYVRSEILNHPYVPVGLDVDAAAAVERGLEPFYTAPPRPGKPGPYADGRYWMPSKRHGGRTNVAFVGGHVLASDTPEAESWNWDYQGGVGK